MAEIVRIGEQQTINLPPPVNGVDPDAEDLKIIRAEEIKSVVKR